MLGLRHSYAARATPSSLVVVTAAIVVSAQSPFTLPTTAGPAEASWNQPSAATASAAMPNAMRLRQRAAPVRTAVRVKTTEAGMSVSSGMGWSTLRAVLRSRRLSRLTFAVVDDRRGPSGRHGAEAHRWLLALGLVGPHFAANPAGGAGRIWHPQHGALVVVA